MNRHSDHSTSSTTSLVQDPVCGMDVDPATSEHRIDLDGHEYYFCSTGCRATFEAQPGSYLSSASGHSPSVHEHGHEQGSHASHADHRASANVVDASPGEVAEWTCPMHPEIRRPGPGSCPIFGLAVEPIT